jgi:hypothetical protein
MTMHVLTETEIDSYLDKAWPDVASSVGAYHAEGLRGADLFSRIDGDWFSVLGMPLLDVLSFLRLARMAPGMTTKDVPLAGVIGDPVAHSLSPKLHGHWLKRYGLRGHYVPMRVAQSDLVQVLRALPLMGFKGVNVTIPHKEHVLSLADSVTDRAALIGAANTLTFTSQGGSRPTIPMAAGFISNIRQSVPGWTAPRGRARPGKWRRGEGHRLGAAQ